MVHVQSMVGRLRSQGIRIQRARVRESMYIALTLVEWSYEQGVYFVEECTVLNLQMLCGT